MVKANFINVVSLACRTQSISATV